MTISMAGVDCRELFTLMTTFFGQGTNFANDPFGYLDGAPSIRPPLALTDTDDTDEEGEGSSSATPASTVPTGTATAPSSSVAPEGPVDILEPKEPQVKIKPKTQYADKMPSLAQTKGFFPLDQDTLHNTGIPATHHVKRAGSTPRGRSIYICSYEAECSSPPYTGDIASAGSHVRRHHLGHSLVCPYCGLRFYNGSGWKDHMMSKHTGMPMYGNQVGPMVHPVSVPVGGTGESMVVTGAVPLAAAISEPDPVDTLPYVPDADDEEEGEATAPPATETTTDPTETATATGSEPLEAKDVEVAFKETDTGIGRYTLKELRRMFENFLPSDLRKYEYYGGGSWMGRRVRATYPPMVSLFTALASQGTEKLEDLEPEEGEEPLRRKKRKHQIHSFQFGPSSHKIWRPDQDPDGGASTA